MNRHQEMAAEFQNFQSPTACQRLAVREPPNDFAVMYQRWAGLLFLHWPVDPAIIQDRLPRGLKVDTFNGEAWLGVVPFFMERVRPRMLPTVPGLSWFMELNVRTYVYDAEGRPGVWFFSLDCNQFLAVQIAKQFFHLPYEYAKMQSQRGNNQINYHCRRGAKQADYIYQEPRVAHLAESGSLEWFLVERYLLFSEKRDGSLYCGRVHHLPYRISAMACEKWSAEPLAWNGFEVPQNAPPSVLVAKPVDVSIFPLRKFQGKKILEVIPPL